MSATPRIHGLDWRRAIRIQISSLCSMRNEGCNMDFKDLASRGIDAARVRLSGGGRVGKQWDRAKLPESMEGKSFLDVGCWEGNICAEAVRRGASAVLGIDYCASPDLQENLQAGGFAFLQMDVFSEKLLELPEFDVVHCAGVLYHVENPMSLLFRLRKLCTLGGLIYIETSCAVLPTDLPMMLFLPGSTMDDNPSNWWCPNELCFREMLVAAGLTDIDVTSRSEPPPPEPIYGRVTIRGTVANTPASISEKVLPRRPSFMPTSPGQGNRRGVAR